MIQTAVDVGVGTVKLGSVAVGNLIAIFLILFFLGVVTLRYRNPREVGGFSVFIGLVVSILVGILLASGYITLLGWFGYVAFSVVVAIVQVYVFDMRNFANTVEVREGLKCHPLYRWMYSEIVYENYKAVGYKAKVDRTGLPVYFICYVLTAPFLVTHWVFHEVISQISDWVSCNIFGRLQKRLDRMM